MQSVQLNGTRSADFLHDHRIDTPGASPARPGKEAQDPHLHFTHLLSILRCHSKFVFAVTVAGTVLAGIVGLLLPRRYTAAAEIVVNGQQADAFRGAATLDRAPDETAIDTQVAMLHSRDRLQRVLESLSGQPGFPRLEPGAASAEAARALDELERHLTVAQVRRSRVIAIRFTATNPKTAAEVANRIADLHIAGGVDEKRAQIRQELSRLDSRAADLKKIMEQAAAALQSAAAHPSPGGDALLAEIRRKATAAGQAYAGVLQRQAQLRVQEESVTPEAHVLSRAAPPDRPSSPSPILFIFPALIASAVCGSLLAVLRDRLDRRLRSEQDVTELLGLTCIGLLPRLRVSLWTPPHVSLLRKPFSPYAEAIRSSAARLQLGATTPRSTTVLISSSVPGEGKTTVAMSLAVYTARLGRRTLLVDTDFRRLSVLRKRHASHDEAVDELPPAAAAQLIRPIPDLGFDYLPVPRSSIDPLQFFWGSDLKHFLQGVREKYECILIDGPPLLGATEAWLLRKMADKVLFLVKWESTRQEVAQNAINLLRKSGEPGIDATGGEIVAMVTQVDLRKHARYGYGDTVEALVKYKEYYFGRTAARHARIARAKWRSARLSSAQGDRQAVRRIRDILARSRSRLTGPFRRAQDRPAASRPANPPQNQC
jgi:polysaccharide biosynthesis transport protein